MALTMLFYQKLRTQRKLNEAIFEQTRFGTKIDRLSRNITNTQKMYEGKMKQIQQAADRMKKQASVFFRSMNGLGTNDVNINMMGFNGLTGFVVNAMQSALSGKQFVIDANGAKAELSAETYQQMMQAYMAYGSNFQYKMENGKPVYKNGKDDTEGYELAFQDWQVAAFKTAMQNAQWAQGQAQTNSASMTQQYENNVSIWQEAMEAQIEAEQEAALEPLQYEQTMMDLDKAACDERVTRLRAELESYSQACEQEAKNSAPKFGL